MLGLGKTGLTACTGWWCAAQGLYTGLIPAIVLLNVPNAVTNTFAIIIGVVSAVTYLVVGAAEATVDCEPAPAEVPPAPATAYSGQAHKAVVRAQA